jgi:hypothetical protein
VNTLISSVIDEIARELYVAAISREYGSIGVAALKELMTALRDLFRYLEPETLIHPLILCKAFDPNDLVLSEPPNTTTFSLDTVPREIAGPSVIQMRADGVLLVWRNVTLDVKAISEKALVYMYQSRQDFFIIRGDQRPVPNPSSTHASVFAIPTFRVLRDALVDYRNRMIRTSRCKIFSQVWRDKNRLLLRSKPEAAMRDSLAQFLTSVLGGDVEARPEQNVDESHPVDVKVTWLFTNRHALIEIKWLGRSVGPSGETTSYTDSRARAGAGQLADYLDKDKMQAPQKVNRGYLVVIDARRQGVHEATVAISKEHGMHYEHQEVAYDPKYHEIRNDFEEPIRMFAEPICR